MLRPFRRFIDQVRFEKSIYLHSIFKSGYQVNGSFLVKKSFPLYDRFYFYQGISLFQSCSDALTAYYLPDNGIPGTAIIRNMFIFRKHEICIFRIISACSDKDIIAVVFPLDSFRDDISFKRAKRD
ncbi:Uncharacterised protein [uncultured archaeon]|nr:Uncharacterised protein [uncultured archaeon]